jgi:hypothetical protein
MVKNRCEQIVLALEMVVQGPLRKPSLFGDNIDTDSGKTFCIEEFICGLKDPILRVD